MGKDLDLFQLVKNEDVPGLTRMFLKARQAKSKLLVTSKKINVNIQDSDGMSCLHQAALTGNMEVLRILLEAGASVDSKDNKAMRPLHYAAWQGRPHPVGLLLQWGASVNECASDGETPLHLTCQHGHLEVVSQLLYYHGNPCVRNLQQKTPLDLACEHGRYRVVELLLNSRRCLPLLTEDADDMEHERTTCLHLAARKGHVDIVRLLIKHGMDVNRTTMNGTCLHEAAMYCKLEVIELLLETCIDVHRKNCYDQTALDIVNSFPASRLTLEIKQLIKEAVHAVIGRTSRDHHDPSDPHGLSFREGEIVTVLQRNDDGRWKGIIYGDRLTSRIGYFPASAVVLLDRPVGGMQRPSKPAQVKKVPPPIAPDLPQNRNSIVSGSSGYSSGSGGTDRNSFGADDSFTLPPSPGALPPPRSPNKDCGGECSPHYNTKSGDCSSPSRFHPSFFPNQPYSTLYNRPSTYTTPVICDSTSSFTHVYQQQSSLEDQGIDVASPGRDSPSSSGSSHSASSGCRNSTTSLDSGRASSSAYDGKLGPGYLPSPGQHRLSSHSYESSSSLRHSYHSSSSSLGSMDRSEDVHSSINVGSMLADGVPETEVLSAWLSDLHYEEYFNLFVQAGYDLPTISRMTPEDLTAIGITKPTHRKKLKAEIANLNISDGLPEYIPDSLPEWLQLLRLEQYLETLTSQGYGTVTKVTELTWEDLEEIGIKKLGHQKKIMLAIKRIKDISSGVRRYSTVSSAPTVASSESVHYVYPTIHHPPPSPLQYPPNLQHSALVDPAHYTHTYTPSVDRGSDYSDGSPSHVIYRPDVVAIQVRQPSGARSLENLEDSTTSSLGALPGAPMRHQTFFSSTDSRLYETLGWRRSSFDDGDITPTNESGPYEMEGGGTLPRPKASIKPRPIAKISATKPNVIKDLNIDLELLKNKENSASKEGLNSPRHVLIESSGGGLPPATSSPRHILPNSPRGSLFRSKKTPPPPPKRTNSVRTTDHLSADQNTTQVSEEVFAACVKNLTTKFSMSQQMHSEKNTPPVMSQSPSLQSDTSSSTPEPGLDYQGSESPPPPAPTSSATNHETESLLLPKRNESTSSFDSSVSSSSTESNLPFANENVGTIKQRQQRAHPSLAVFDMGDPTAAPPSEGNSAPSTPSHHAGSRTSSGPCSRTSPAHTPGPCSRASPAHSSRTSPSHTAGQAGETEPDDTPRLRRPHNTGDVLSDIGNMLADLTDELDAMLEEELLTSS